MKVRLEGRPTLVGLAVGILAGALSCSGSPPSATPRLVILYAPCTVNTKFLSPYNPEVTYTPNLERFARRSTVFTKHQTEAGQSGIAYASIFSGQQANGHGIYTIPMRLPDEVMLISEMYRDAGHEVFAWLAHGMASADLNYAQGTTPSNAFPHPLIAEDPALRTILQRLKNDPEHKAFLMTNFTVTHGPYRVDALEEFCRRYPDECGSLRDMEDFEELAALHATHNLSLSFDFPRTIERLGLSTADVQRLAAVCELLYKSNVFHLDQLFGALLDEIREAGLLDESVIVFTADHGEVLYRTNAIFKWSHSLQLAPEVLRVPFIVSVPASVEPVARYDAVTRSIDVLPTMAGLSGIMLPEGSVAGVDLSMVIGGQSPGIPLSAFSHTSILPPPIVEASKQWGELQRVMPSMDPALMWVSARQGDIVYKLQSPDGVQFAPEVYDLSVDPGESIDLYDPDDPDHRNMVAALREYKAALVGGYRSGKLKGEKLPEPEQAEKLRSLGYIE